VSDALRNPPAGMAEVHHVASLDMETAILGAEVIALMLQPAVGERHLEQFVELVCNFFRGKGGDAPTRSALKEAEGNPDRIVRLNSKDEVNDQTRQTFRVSVTRAKRRTTILTPQGDPFILLNA
jgi:hypothetical protein